MTVHDLHTERLSLVPLSEADAQFIVQLLNDADFLRYIGDRGVHNRADASEYLDKGPFLSYAENGFGLLLVRRNVDGVSIGICGLVKRDGFEQVDLGFALLPQYRRRGYAFEASEIVLHDAATRLGLSSVVAIVNQDNGPSIALLRKLGFEFECMVRLNNETAEVCMYKTALAQEGHSG